MTAGAAAARRLLALGLVVAAVLCGYFGLRPDDSAQASPARRLTTPLWSPRRLPQPIVDGVGSQRLQGALDVHLDGGQSCVVVADGMGVLAAHNPDLGVTPASTQKLLTAAVVLSTLGPGFRFETKAVAATPPSGGSADRLWLVGTGDPGLSTSDYQALLADNRQSKDTVTTSLAALADSIVAAGVRRIPGGIDGDDSRYDAQRYLPTWKDSYRTDGQVGPVGALTVNHGFSTLKPKPVPVDDPAAFAALQLTRLLKDRGVEVGPNIGRSRAPDGAATVATVQSPPLDQMVASFLRASDNLAAEMFTRELGARVAGQGTTAAGTKVIADKLRELGVPVDGLTLVDGSGLDRGDRVTCKTLLAALGLGARPEFTAIWNGLAVAGQTGTLEDELRGTPLEGRLRAKTGSLQGVTGLTGLVELGRAVVFAFVENGDFSERGGIAIRARVAEIIGGFPDSPPAEKLVPMPETGG